MGVFGDAEMPFAGARWCLANGVGGINGSRISFGHRLGASRRLRKWGGL